VSLLAIGAVCFWLGSATGHAAGVDGPSDERRNIVFILTDDQRFDALGLLNDYFRTPNLDRLAEAGVLFATAREDAGMLAALGSDLISKRNKGKGVLQATVFDCTSANQRLLKGLVGIADWSEHRKAKEALAGRRSRASKQRWTGRRRKSTMR